MAIPARFSNPYQKIRRKGRTIWTKICKSGDRDDEVTSVRVDTENIPMYPTE